MIINDTGKRRRKVSILTPQELIDINDFLKEDFIPKLYSEKWTAVRDVYGGGNKDWSKYPHLETIYQKYFSRYNDYSKASRQAAVELGHIVANLLRGLPDNFEKQGKFRAWSYRLARMTKSIQVNWLPDFNSVNIPNVEIAINIADNIPSPSVNNKKPSKPKKHNSQSDIDKKILGDRGEEIVVEFEKLKLKEWGFDSSKVKHIAKTDDTAGYDIESFDENGNPILIEVKSTSRDNKGYVEFNISDNEYTKATKESNYWIYLVFKANTTDPKICRFNQLFSKEGVEVTPTSYKVRFTAK
jgi:hypothetical protein